MEDNINKIKRILECLLFVSNEPLETEKLSQITECDKILVKQALAELEAEYAERGFLLRHMVGGWQFFTASEHNDYIEKLYRPRTRQLSKAKLETLAIIAYKQPLTRQDIENIRQVNSDSIVTALLEKNLIREVGRRDTPGRPILYGTTEEFLNYLGLASLKELPPLEQLLAAGITEKSEDSEENQESDGE